MSLGSSILGDHFDELGKQGGKKVIGSARFTKHIEKERAT